MATALYWHDDCLNHVTPQGHPERVARLEAIREALSDPTFDALDRREAPIVDRAELLRVHPEHHVAAIEAAAPQAHGVSLDADTHMSPGSLVAAQRAAGACVAAVDAVMAGAVANAFAAVRPPGHHAENATPMGFCLFGSIAVAAKRALDHHGLSRVAIMDFDVHHGNGTQDLMWDEARCLFASTHQMPLYPGSGAPSETGAHGNVINAPLAPHTNGADFRKLMEREVLPALDQFAPEMVLISAGFDAHRDDPLANLNWEAADFAWVTGTLCDLADKHAGGRVVSTLEGGYDLGGLADSIAAHVKVLMERGA
ncbi:histone deacetylase family protein [Actibacterium sp. 188UL27-1]|uniref:histone deacetylase family protein n=1 Tax=Actibacterium sp. 188UL27-1 TaxID=2786961 RepID=UPI0019571A6D|nr:histone deacetylase family protein [Actibacterium sp. 188UL27-1]MBM7068967.1 histone deacetylase family protein [Actibacterium sp. 188UL27-1]